MIVLNPFGTLELQKYCADDLDVVNAAKVSFAKYSAEMGDHEKGLVKFLLVHNHMSPFEHNYFKFKVRAPIAVARDWVRHRIGIAWNEESGRYVKLRPHFYLPEDQHVRTQVGKPGSYTFQPLEPDWKVTSGKSAMTESYQIAWETYDKLMDDYGWAKELARYVLPVGIYTEWIWSCNARSLMHFLTLRNDINAMLEIRLYAGAMEDMFSQIMPHTWSFFRERENI